MNVGLWPTTAGLEQEFFVCFGAVNSRYVPDLVHQANLRRLGGLRGSEKSPV